MRRCVKCSGPSGVYETRENDDTVRRARECKVCGHRWTTLEVSHEQMARYRLLERGLKDLQAVIDALPGIGVLTNRLASFNKRESSLTPTPRERKHGRETQAEGEAGCSSEAQEGQAVAIAGAP